VGLKLNGTRQLLLYADDVNLLGVNINAIKKNTGTLIDAGKEVGLEGNREKTNYMLMTRHQNAGQNRDMKTDNCITMFKCLGMTVTNKNLIHEKSRTDSSIACYHFVFSFAV
jgi:hypothetical protein